MSNWELRDLLIRGGVDAWNAWRKANPHIDVDLSDDVFCREGRRAAAVRS